MAVMTYSDITNLYNPIIRAKFDEGVGRIDSVIPAVFNVMESTGPAEKLVDVLGPDLFAAFTGTHNAGAAAEGFDKTFTHTEYEQELEILKSIFDDGNVISAYVRASAFGFSASKTRESHAAAVFNNAFTTQLAADGEALCAATHPYSPTDATTQSNAGSTALSSAAVTAARLAMLKFVDANGNPSPSIADTLLVPPDLAETANTIANTMQAPGGSNNDVNFNRGLRVIVWPYLTDANNWFLIDSALAQDNLFWFNRVPLEITLDPSSEYDRVMRYSAYMRYSLGPTGWQWVYGSAVA